VFVLLGVESGCVVVILGVWCVWGGVWFGGLVDCVGFL